MLVYPEAHWPHPGREDWHDGQAAGYQQSPFKVIIYTLAQEWWLIFSFSIEACCLGTRLLCPALHSCLQHLLHHNTSILWNKRRPSSTRMPWGMAWSLSPAPCAMKRGMRRATSTSPGMMSGHCMLFTYKYIHICIHVSHLTNTRSTLCVQQCGTAFVWATRNHVCYKHLNRKDTRDALFDKWARKEDNEKRAERTSS